MAQQHIDFESYYNNYLSGLKRKAEIAVREALTETWADFFITVDERVREIFNDVIDDFYSDYSPDYYNRDNSLYNLLQTSVGTDSLSIWFEPDQMTPLRSGYSGEDGLYDQVFRKGWHGGAGSGDGHPDSGAPYWRTPVPYYSHWGKAAPVAAYSPLEDMKRRVADYEKNEMQADFNRIWSVRARNIKIDS